LEQFEKNVTLANDDKDLNDIHKILGIQERGRKKQNIAAQDG
jgi:hypothetical protein